MKLSVSGIFFPESQLGNVSVKWDHYIYEREHRESTQLRPGTWVMLLTYWYFPPIFHFLALKVETLQEKANGIVV